MRIGDRVSRLKDPPGVHDHGTVIEVTAGGFARVWWDCTGFSDEARRDLSELLHSVAFLRVLDPVEALASLADG